MEKIIFTDLDGTLLDHSSYGYEPALPALARIKRLSIPLIFCSSKTAAELEVIREEMAVTDPFISENGGGIHFPEEGQVVTLGLPYEHLEVHLEEIRGQLGLNVQSMLDMSVDELVSATGLSPRDALLAQRRDYDLAFLVKGAIDYVALEDEVKRRKLRLTRGARFLHLTGNNDKGMAVRKVAEFYQARTERKIETIGLGDSENDLPMLEVVDLPVIIPNQGSEAPLRLESPNLIVASSPGPEGWNEVVLSLLDFVSL